MIEWTELAIPRLDQAHDHTALSSSGEVATGITMQIVTSVQQHNPAPRASKAPPD